MRAFHAAHGEQRHRVIIPDSAHGTNPASVTLGGYEVTTVPSRRAGLRRHGRAARRPRHRRRGHHADEPEHARALRGGHRSDRRGRPRGRRAPLLRRREPQRHPRRRPAGRHGVRHRPHEPAQDVRHAARRWRPGAGPVAVSPRLVDFLPGPRPVRLAVVRASTRRATATRTAGRCRRGRSVGSTRGTATRSCSPGRSPTSSCTAATASGGWPNGRCSTPTGSASGSTGRSTCRSTGRACTRWSCRRRRCASSTGRKALDVAKRLLEDGFHSPTVYFPLIVDEALMVEPTETESLQTLRGAGRGAGRDRGGGVVGGRRVGGRTGAPDDAGPPGRRGSGGADADPDVRRPALTSSVRAGQLAPDRPTQPGP